MKKLILLIFFYPTLVFSQTGGTFDVVYTTTDSMVYDTPGAFMSIHTTIHNLSATDSVELNILKQFVDIPATWETAICTDICYPASVSSINLSLAPADSQEFVFYFYTDLVADSGYAKVLYTNLNVPGNAVLHGYHGITQSTMSVFEIDQPTFSVYPNPTKGVINLKNTGSVKGQTYFIMDELGRTILSGKLADNQSSISIEQLIPGFYFLNFGSSRAGSAKIIKQ